MPKAKSYNLTDEEKTHLLSRKNVISYISDMIKNEMNAYILQVVRKRLDIPETIDIEIDIEHGTIKTKAKPTND
jgi:hypothetical protein